MRHRNAPFERKRHHATRHAHLALSQLVLGMLWQAGVVDVCHGRMSSEEFRNSLGVAAVCLHAQRQRFDTTHNQEQIPWCGYRTDGVFDVAQAFGQLGIVGHERAANHVAVSAVVFGGAIADDVGTECEWLHQIGRGKGIVDHRQGIVPLGNLAEGGDVGHTQHGIGGAFHPEQFGVIGHGCSHCCLVGDIHKGGRHAMVGKNLGEQAVCAAIDVVTGHHMVARGEQVQYGCLGG